MLFLVHDKDSNDVKFHGIQAFYLKENTMASSKDIIDNPIANYDSDRKGIFIHKHQLNDSGFKVGDRFSVKVGKQDLFAISIVKDGKGDIVYDKNGIFIERTRRIVLYFESDVQESIKLRPLEAVIKNNYM
jgi:hypothetical protein